MDLRLAATKPYKIANGAYWVAAAQVASLSGEPDASGRSILRPCRRAWTSEYHFSGDLKDTLGAQYLERIATKQVDNPSVNLLF